MTVSIEQVKRLANMRHRAMREKDSEIERLRVDLAAERERVEKLSQENAALRCDAAGGRERVAKLREVLEPFVIPRDGAHSGALYNDSVVFAFEGHKITVGHFRHARTVLAETKGDANEQEAN
jgi:hypothetical protein